MTSPKQEICTFFMFNGKAEEAINLYTSLFDRSEIQHLHRYENGTVMHAAFTLKGQVFMAIDNVNQVDHAFTPALSLFVTCDSEEEIRRVFERLSQDGSVLVPLSPIPMSKLFGWVQDRFGVSWQISLPLE